MMFEKLVGLSFISAAAEIILSGSSFRKYVKTVTGAVFALILITGIFGIAPEVADFPDYELPREASEAEEEYEKMLYEEVVSKTERKIGDELSREGIEIKDVSVEFFPDYRVKKLEINMENSSLYKEKALNILKGMGFAEEILIWG